MRKALWALPLLAACLAVPASAGAATAHTRPLAGGTWGHAKEVPGIAALDVGKDSELIELTCASVGNCVAGGYYTDSSRNLQAFLASETNGTWGNAEEVPGTAALNQRYALLGAVSCPSVGNCSAGGFYVGSTGQQAYVINETNGTLGERGGSPGHGGPQREGECGAVGYYQSSTGTEVFDVDETNGAWGSAAEIPGTAALNTGNNAFAPAVSCASAGNCGATGWYDTSSGTQAFVVSEADGIWGNAKPVPGLTTLDPGGTSNGEVASCQSPGHCGVGGDYAGSGFDEPFVVGEY